MKPYGEMDFNDLTSLSMDMDYINAIAVEPSALQYNNFNQNYGFDAHTASYVSEFAAAQFPFTFQHDPSSPSDSSSLQSSVSGRRLSISSSVSSSGASFSPAPESAPSPNTAKRTEFVANYSAASEQTSAVPAASDLVAQLAERVRQSAGVMLALPMTAQLQAFENQQQAENIAPTSPAAAPKLPIPRLPRPSSQSIPSSSSVSSAASTPPPTTPSAPSPPTLAPSAPVPRLKTSHTTIERRYRTNLNARIQSLRMAVPALRVVDDRDANKKRAPNKVLVSGDPLKAGGEDVIDERGFVDGVKVARKCSKANVLGKAVEYIRVLKKREGRLKAEQAGLKSLVIGLVGGPALLKEWEREWKAVFGGEEKDEVEGEVEADGDDEEDDLDDDDDEEGGRKRKRGKTMPLAQDGVVPVKVEKKEKKIVLGPEGQVPEKRKRGRPRKVVPLPVPQLPTAAPMEQEQPQASQQQYLLATFALFSFFNSPLTSPSSTAAPTHVHTGTVLNGSSVPHVTDVAGNWGLSYYLQIFHLLVSIIVFLSCISNWLGGFGFFGKSRSSIFSILRKKEQKTPVDWLRLGETYVLSDNTSESTLPLISRLQAYYNITSIPTLAAADLCTAALTLHGSGTFIGGLARARARAVWSSIRIKGAKAYERLVLEELSVDDASAKLDARTINNYVGDGEDGELGKPIRVLASAVVRERVGKHLGLLFVGSVRGEEDVDAEERGKEVKERRRTIEAAKELGGMAGELGRRLERLWKVPSGSVTEDVAKEYESGSEEEDDAAEVLATVLVLYRRVFSFGSAGNGASALMSPPPSPGREGKGKDTSDVARLRRALGSRIFEESEALEDARDRVVDMVVELERRKVGLD
ncbi:hypothetical protein H0H87_011204 [Tephrocybe sp. NHM501043]|nr:hypothetical protein H0H87_011204 [Tephrocybe sp. NHM501043]